MTKRMMLAVALVMIGCLLLVGALRVQAGGYEISWWSVDNGGGAVASGAYAISGGVGQADAHASITAGAYTVVGGFWVDQPPTAYVLYLPVQRK